LNNNNHINENENVCLQVYAGHSKAVTSLFMKCKSYQEDDSELPLLYSTSNDCTVRAWNIETGECVKVYEGSKNWLTCGVATENYICCAGYDYNIHIFDEKTGKQVHLLKGHTKRIEDLIIANESEILYSVSVDGTVRAWDIESGDCLNIYSLNNQCKQIALYEPKNILLCKLATEISFLDLNENQRRVPILAMNSFTTYGRYLIGWQFEKKLFQVWDIKDRMLIYEQQCTQSGDMISTPCMKYSNGVLYFAKGNAVHLIEMNFTRNNSKASKSKEHKDAPINETPLYMKFQELFHYFTMVLERPSKQVADAITDLAEQGSLNIEMPLEEQIDLLDNYYSNILARNKKKEGKKIAREASPDRIGDVDFMIDVNPYENLLSEKDTMLPNQVYEMYTEEEKELDFESRVELFYNKLRPATSEHLQPTVLLVRRSELVYDACKHFSIMSNSDLRKPMIIHFDNELGLDVGGVTREFYRLLSEQILDPNNALFLKTGVNGTYHPNPTSTINVAHLQYFKFIGKLVGKCLYDMNLMDTHFSKVIFKLIVGKPIQFDDLQYCDPSLYLAMRNILNCEHVENMYLTFTAELNDFGNNNTYELVHDGKNIPVTKENCREFVQLYSRWKLVESVRPQLSLFLAGLYSIIPRPYFSIFSESEVELLLCGRPQISVKDWKQFCKYEAGFSESHPTINCFWRMVEEMNHTQRSKLLQFVTGTSCVPPEGFRGFYPHFTICCVYVPKNINKNKYLPVAHTCLNRIDFPAYDIAESEEKEDTSGALTVDTMTKFFEEAIKQGLADGFSIH
jgi:hypothetical protein